MGNKESERKIIESFNGVYNKIKRLNEVGYNEIKNVETSIITKFVEFLPDNLIKLMEGYSKNKGVRYDEVYTLFIYSYLDSFNEENGTNLELDLHTPNDEYQKLITSRFGYGIPFL